MTMSMFEASAPVLLRALGNLDHVLGKGAAYAEARGGSPDALLQARLIWDMFPLLKQVQIATDTAKGCVARLAGVEAPVFEDNETKMAELRARVARTRDYVATLTPDQIDGSEERAIVLKMRSGELHYSGADYLREFVLPNFFFHCVTAYDILRAAGVVVGKRDFLAGGVGA